MNKRDQYELLWWREVFSCRVTPDSDYIPKPGDALHSKRFRIVEVTEDGPSGT